MGVASDLCGIVCDDGWVLGWVAKDFEEEGINGGGFLDSVILECEVVVFLMFWMTIEEVELDLERWPS